MIEIRNRTTGSEFVSPSSGSGIIGMTERVAWRAVDSTTA
jgi:hypothetical protein